MVFAKRNTKEVSNWLNNKVTFYVDRKVVNRISLMMFVLFNNNEPVMFHVTKWSNNAIRWIKINDRIDLIAFWNFSSTWLYWLF